MRLISSKYSRTKLLQRIEKLEAQLTDVSGLVPDSPEWLAYWQKQVELYFAGKEHAPLTLEGVRAYMQSVPDDYHWNDADGPPPELPATGGMVRRRTGCSCGPDVVLLFTPSYDP